MSKLLGKGDLEILAFANKQALYDWMTKNHDSYDGIWLRIYKKASGVQSIVWAEAVEVCLCFGWIDGVVNRYDDESYLQRLTPRRRRSNWSKINCETTERLIKDRLMQPAGLAQIDAAKADGRWDRAYDSPKNMKVPDDFLNELELYPKAKENYIKLKKTPLFFIGYSLATAKKPETRLRRMKNIIEKLEKDEPF